MSSFFKGTTVGMRIAFAGFLVALYGGLTGAVAAWIGIQWAAVFEFILVMIGVILGFIGIIWGWAELGKRLFKTPNPDSGSEVWPSFMMGLNERLRQKSLSGLRTVFMGIICAALGSVAFYLGEIVSIAWLGAVGDIAVLVGFGIGVIGVVLTYAQLLVEK